VSKRVPDISVLTANRLHDGTVVFLASDGRWVVSVDAAAVARTAEEARALQEQGARDSAANLVVEPYLAEIAESGGRRVPARMRERVRVDGPSILDDVPGYAGPVVHGVRPLASNVRVSHNGRREGSDPVSVEAA
jgi:hypothetical protein